MSENRHFELMFPGRAKLIELTRVGSCLSMADWAVFMKPRGCPWLSVVVTLFNMHLPEVEKFSRLEFFWGWEFEAAGVTLQIAAVRTLDKLCVKYFARRGYADCTGRMGGIRLSY